MNLELKNAEGYDDPTAYEAIKNVTKKEKRRRRRYTILRFSKKKADKCKEVK